MDERTLFRKLKSLKREVADLKTAYKKGLGATDWYSMSVEIQIPKSGEYTSFYLSIFFDEKINHIPFVQIFSSYQRREISLAWEEAGKTYQAGFSVDLDDFPNYAAADGFSILVISTDKILGGTYGYA